ncbi:MAG: Stk1 family PASTA domain-containing Ser/Thr kinase [Clostridiales bacterium]|nr:Stk1 family PASTA domain-containing Ser/Thr kinase [Clostridiales bacterium]
MGTLVLAGRYEIIEKIGDGGMAVVYKARDKQLNRFVAIKILKKEFIADQTFVENFIREAKAAASLLHPNIVTIHDAGKDRDIYYIVMEYVEGHALSDVIAAEAPLDYKRCIRVTKQIASALALAHRNNIIHRDVKPHNILITTDGTAKITDFGIAKAVSDGTIINDSGIVMGSVHYFSPEQSRGQYVDEKSDIYSLGIVLYEMITGSVPFDADNPVTIAVMHMNETIIPPSRLVRGVPPGLDQIVLKATAKYQSDRFNNIEEMYKALDNVNFITGAIDDPEIAGFVQPTNIKEETPGRGYSNAAAPVEGPYEDDDYPDEEPDYRKSRRGKGDDYDEDDDYDDDDDGGRRGFFGLFGGGAGKDYDDDDEDDDEDDGRKGGRKKPQGKLDKKQKMILIIAAVAIAVILSIPLSKAIISFFNYEPVIVPDVVGLFIDEATDILKEEGFTVDIETVPLPPVKSWVPDAGDDLTDLAGGLLFEPEPEYDDEPMYSEGEVMDQDPQGGEEARPGSKVKLTVAGAPMEAEPDDGDLSQEIKEVPDVMGKSKADAERAIAASGFRPTVTYDNSEEPVDTVINQSPKAGEMAPGNSLIYIVVSLGPKEATVDVPSLVGLTIEQALTMAENGDFIINVTERDSDSVPKGTIMDQNPPSGSSIKEGGIVNVLVSSGPKTAVTGVTVNPGTASINKASGTVQFSATVSGSGDFSQDVTWSVSGGGTVSGSGLYTAPKDPGSYTAYVTATSNADGSKSGTATVTVNIEAPKPPDPPKKYNVTVGSGGHGSISGGGSFEAGQTVTITATPDDGYELDKWEVTGVSTDLNGLSISFAMPKKDVSVKVFFKEIE